MLPARHLRRSTSANGMRDGRPADVEWTGVARTDAAATCATSRGQAAAGRAAETVSIQSAEVGRSPAASASGVASRFDSCSRSVAFRSAGARCINVCASASGGPVVERAFGSFARRWCVAVQFRRRWTRQGSLDRAVAWGASRRRAGRSVHPHRRLSARRSGRSEPNPCSDRPGRTIAVTPDPGRSLSSGSGYWSSGHSAQRDFSQSVTPAGGLISSTSGCCNIGGLLGSQPHVYGN